MTDKRTQQQASESNMEKDPADWVTGDEPMTGAQRSYLKTLSEEAHEPFDEHLTKAEASRRIDELQAITGRGQPLDKGSDGNGKSGGSREGDKGTASTKRTEGTKGETGGNREKGAKGDE